LVSLVNSHITRFHVLIATLEKLSDLLFSKSGSVIA